MASAPQPQVATALPCALARRSACCSSFATRPVPVRPHAIAVLQVVPGLDPPPTHTRRQPGSPPLHPSASATPCRSSSPALVAGRLLRPASHAAVPSGRTFARLMALCQRCAHVPICRVARSLALPGDPAHGRPTAPRTLARLPLVGSAPPVAACSELVSGYSRAPPAPAPGPQRRILCPGSSRQPSRPAPSGPASTSGVFLDRPTAPAGFRIAQPALPAPRSAASPQCPAAFRLALPPRAATPHSASPGRLTAHRPRQLGRGPPPLGAGLRLRLRPCLVACPASRSGAGSTLPRIRPTA
nr:translation initiation factor IF-2-like [Aegilops tauschii subsp. strangulata]